ncbi:type II secretion system F family protein [Croceicoccus naphthovorans]|uniref:Secretion system protein n=1 Tax=Croceicoccus naphthovorans TaxID=1348774 RepID=A0A0G3XFZ5_9SPHN|nr:type II secretion system F family protein [Croceicoccus naphthovorans]AKM09536.1 secretion system protein [Croceicoccus naphthovorans]MBB3989714.1 tight adherence protein B [Croceicoccus naphthovorans]
MIDILLKVITLIAVFGTVFLISQVGMDYVFSKTAHTRAVNKRLRMIREGSTREEILARLRKAAPKQITNLPGFMVGPVRKLERTLMTAQLSLTASQVMFMMLGAFVGIMALLLLAIGGAGIEFSAGTFVLTAAIATCAGIFVPLMVIGSIAQRRRKKIEEQFPVALDVFVRALRAGHPIASAIELLTTEMEDPIGSEFGLVADEVAYGAELTDALSAMAERWDLEDIRMFVVSLSVQNETGGNLAEILQNLSEVIRARASLYMKVRALSSEGRMTGWMLTILPIVAFLGLFTVNPEFYLSVAQETMFIVGFICLMALYLIGFFWIKALVNIKV